MKLVNIDSLCYDKDLYPRNDVNFVTVCRFREAMRSGSVFPPVLVGKMEGKNYLLDGWHRVKATVGVKRDTIRAVVKPLRDRRSAFVLAITSNIRHGLPLSLQEVIQVGTKLETEFSVPRKDVAHLLQFPVDTYERYCGERIITDGAATGVLKSTAVSIDRREWGNVREILEAQAPLSGKKQTQILMDTILLLRNGLLDLKDPKVVELTNELYVLLKKVIRK